MVASGPPPTSFSQAVALLREAGDQHGLARALMGWHRAEKDGRLRSAISSLTESLAIVPRSWRSTL